MEGGDLLVSSVDQRVVQMKFDNAQFEQGVRQTLADLQNLNKALKLQGGTKGLTDIGAASNSVKLGPLSSAVQSLSDRFKSLSVIGTAALATITSRAVSAGAQMLKSLTLGPVLAGFHNYETQINAVQTILANTGLKGAAGLAKVTAVLNELNTYANKTVYNFAEMAQNIGTFTAAGVGLKASVASIKGIANLAALSGSSSQQASTAMYQLSQAIASGTVHLQDWNSVVNAGLGGKVFQNALIDTARASGVSIDAIIKKAGSFRESLQKGWLTSKILTRTLAQFTGDLSAAQLKSMGFSDKQAQHILALGKTAVDAATKIKTMSQLTQALREEVGTAWGSVFKTIFGDINQATTLFSGIHTVAENALTAPVYALNNLLTGWAKLGGRAKAIDALANVFKALGAVMAPIKDAFREIFPPTTAKQLYDTTVAIDNFTKKLIIGGKTADEIKRTFAGVFAVFGIGWDIIKEVAKTLFGLFSTASKGSGGFLKTTASIGDFLVALRKAIQQGHILQTFFGALGKILALPIKGIQKLGEALGNLFGNIHIGKATSEVGKFNDTVGPLGKFGAEVAKVWSIAGAILKGIFSKVVSLGQAFGNFFSQLASYIGGVDLGDIINTIDITLITLHLTALIKLLKGKISGGGGASGFLDSIKESFESLTGTLSQMQKTLKAATLLELAAAVGILTLSVTALSKIDADGLKRALSAMTVMFVQLGLFGKLISVGGGYGSLILLAAAMDILASAVKKLSDLDWSGLAKGLIGVTVLLAGLAITARAMPDGKKMISSSLGLIAMAEAIKILASAVTTLSGLSWNELAKGLVGVGGLLVGLALFTKFTNANKSGIAKGAGIILLATGIKILASAMNDLSGLSWTEIAKGLVAMAGGLTIMAVALDAIPPSSILSAAAILITASSLKMIGDALQSMGSMSWGEIAKSLVELAGSLIIIAAALTVMDGTLPGAAALVVAAYSLNILADALTKMGDMSWGDILKSLVELAASLTILAAALYVMEAALPGAAALVVAAAGLAILAPILVTFGNMSWEAIGKGLVALAGALTIIGVAGLLLTPVIPTLLGLGLAITLLGAGMALAGAGMFLFGAGLTALAVGGTVAIAALVASITALSATIPIVLKNVALGLLAFAQTLAANTTAFGTAMTTILIGIITAIASATPRITSLLAGMALKMLSTLNHYVPSLISQGARLVVSILNGLASRVGGMVSAATNLIVAFINAVSRNQGRVTDAGVRMIISFVNGLANSIRSHQGAMRAAGLNLGLAIIDGMTGGLASGVGRIASMARSVAQSALNAAKGVLGIHSPSKEFEKIGKYVNDGFLKGLEGSKSEIDKAFSTLNSYLKTLEKSHKSYERARARSAAALLNSKAYKKEHSQLVSLSKKYDSVAAKLKDANDKLTDAKKTRDDFNKQITDQYSALPTIDKDTRLGTYVKSLQTQIKNTQTFMDNLQQLRKMGLNDEAYKQLLAAGPDSLPFIQQLLASGQNGINQINDLDSQLAKEAASLGQTASTNLYQAGVDAAQGLVDGLKKQEAAIQKQMDKIADAMVKAIKKKLHIKSPSRVFAEVGKYSAQGLSEGLQASSAIVEKSAADIGENALEALRSTLSDVSTAVMGEIDVKPTIAPVLDLTGVKKDASQLGSLFTSAPITVEATYTKAAVAADTYQANQAATAEAQTAANNTFNYNQYNNSPKALSNAEIYRQTKNQLSTVKEALDK
jgi:tape measure domain-containing protein